MTEEIGIIRQVLNGDTDSFGLLVQRYQKPIVRMIRNITGDSQACEDIGQDVFFTAYKKLASFDSARSKFSTWLFAIAKNKSLNALKRKRPISLAEVPEKADCHNPGDELAQKEVVAEFDKALQDLPKRQRMAFVLAELEELSYEEIAQIEGARIGTIKSRIHRAKKKLAALLKNSVGDIR